MFQIPEDVRFLLDRLRKNGYESYIVGGCVRDLLLERVPGDWDITTSALPDQIRDVFGEFPAIEIGKQHGTVAIVLNHTPYEITAYRTDGPYQDHRRPDSVSFTASLREDLARRDFTVNALAYHPETGIIDCFSGLEDLKAKRIRAVGDPSKRLEEDALRILRGLRFAAQLGFSVDPETKDAMTRKKDLLNCISKERIRTELSKLLTAPAPAEILRESSEIFFTVLPELSPMRGFAQNNPHHCYDVWEHTLHALDETPEDLTLRLAIFLHDCGKPAVYSEDKDGTGHFYGHAKKSEELARTVLSRLRYDKKSVQAVCTLVKYHDLSFVPEERWMKRWCGRLGADTMRNLLIVARGDVLAQAPGSHQEMLFSLIEQCHKVLDAVIREAQVFQLKDLAVDGRDLIAIGFSPGQALGRCLQGLLNDVIEEECPNEKEALLALAKTKYFSQK